MFVAPVLLGAAKCGTFEPPTKQEQARTQYEICVKEDRSKAKQDLCQQHVWGETFGPSDILRWDCGHMGDWSCSTEDK